jgi:uncharacterized protein
MRALLHDLELPSARQMGIYVVGVLLVAVGAALGLRSGIGGGPYDALLVTLSERLGLGLVAVAWGLQVMWGLVATRLGARLTVGAVVHSLLFGPLIHIALGLLPEAGSIAGGLVYVGLAVAGLSVGLHLYLEAAYLSGILDTVFDSASVRFRVSDATLRRTFDVGCVAYAWIGDGPVGIGTVVIALSVGRVLGWMRQGSPTPGSWRGIGLRAVPRDESGGFADQARRYAEARKGRFVADATMPGIRR